MNNVPVEQICESGIARLDDEAGKGENEQAIRHCVEETYRVIQGRVKSTGKVLVGVNQTISTEACKYGELNYVIYIITLVGTIVDAAAVEAQQRMQQLDPRSSLRGRNN